MSKFMILGALILAIVAMASVNFSNSQKNSQYAKFGEERSKRMRGNVDLDDAPIDVAPNQISVFN